VSGLFRPYTAEDILTWNRSEEEAKDADRAKLLQSARLPLGSLPIVFLGIDDRPTASDGSVPAAVDPSNPKGVPYFALDAGDEDWTFEGGEFGDARNNASNMDGWSAGIFAQARALIDWNGRNKVCHIRCAIRCWSSYGLSSVRHVEASSTRCGRAGRGIVLLLSSLYQENRLVSQHRACTTSRIRERIQ
jgi:NAD+ diphosphatase